MDFWQITGYTVPVRNAVGNPPSLEGFNAGVDTLAENLLKLDKDKIKEMAGLLCDSTVNNKPYWWACFAEELAPYIRGSDWATLCKALGLGHFEEGEWILVWQYEVGHTGGVYKPTVIEAYTTPYHYPSPPSSQCGVAMPLSPGLPICREVIHPPLSGSLAVEACTGELHKIQGYPSENDSFYTNITEIRSNHRSSLEAEFDEQNDQDWFKRHSKPI